MQQTVKCRLILRKTLGSLLLKSIVINIFCFRIVTCQSYYSHHVLPEGIKHQDITVKFPHFSIRVVPSGIQHKPEALQKDVNNNYKLPYEQYTLQRHESYPSSNNYHSNFEITQAQPYTPNQYYPSTTNLHTPNNYNPNHDPVLYDPRLYLPNPSSHKHKQNNWYYSIPTWQPINNDMNILRSPDPRSLIASHSSFVKVHKPFHGSFIKTKHKKIIVGDHHAPVHHVPVHHFAPHGHTTINKNTHVHVHSRNAAENAEISSVDDNRFLGSHLFSAPRWRRDSSLSRNKRGLVEVVKLVGNPKTQVDVSETTKNLGTATRDLFEHEHSPFYHMRNVLGNTHDAMYSLMKVRPTGLLVPSRYKIVNANEDPTVGDINPSIYARSEREPPTTNEEQLPGEMETIEPNEAYGNSNPLHKVGTMLRESVQWAQKSAEHAADAMHSARQVVVTAKKHWPELLLPYAGALEVKSANQGQDCEIVEAARDPQFVGMGKILDSLGLTDVHPNYEPMLGAQHQISEEVQMLNSARKSLGVTTYKQFMDKMKKELERMQKRNDMLKLSLPKPKPLPLSRLRTKLPPPKLNSKITPRVKPSLTNIRNALNVAKAKAKLAPTLARLRTPVHLRQKPGRLLAKEPILASKLDPKQNLDDDDPENVESPIVEPPEPNPTNPKPKGSSKLLGKSSTESESAPVLQSSKDSSQNNENPEMEELANRLQQLRKKLREKLDIPNDDTHSDILGKAMEILEKKNDEHGSRSSIAAQAIPMPMFTKEMKIPFMGFATKEQLEDYYKNMYCSDCKLSKINELLEAASS